MKALKNWWRHPQAQKLINAYMALSEREQRLVTLTLNALIAALILALLLWPAVTAIQAAFHKAAEADIANQELQQQLDILRNQVLHDPNQPIRDELTRVQAQQQLLDERITTLTKALIPPAQMTTLLGSVLEQNKDLQPLSLQSLPPQRVSLGEGYDDIELYRHSLRLRAKATYPALVAYLRALDGSAWTLGWDQLDYQVSSYPYGELTLEVSALSRQQEVLGGR